MKEKILFFIISFMLISFIFSPHFVKAPLIEGGGGGTTSCTTDADCDSCGGGECVGNFKCIDNLCTDICNTYGNSCCFDEAQIGTCDSNGNCVDYSACANSGCCYQGTCYDQETLKDVDGLDEPCYLEYCYQGDWKKAGCFFYSEPDCVVPYVYTCPGSPNCAPCVDTACAGSQVCVVFCEVSETNCADGVDNDCDRVTDCADPDCAGQTGPGGVICCQSDGDCPAQDLKKGKCECPLEGCSLTGTSYICKWPACGSNADCVDQACCGSISAGGPGGNLEGNCIGKGPAPGYSSYLCDPPGWVIREERKSNIFEMILFFFQLFFPKIN
jgi:hypothetical protein